MQQKQQMSVEQVNKHGKNFIRLSLLKTLH